MSWRVEYTARALKQLKKMDRFDARLITSWIGKNLDGCEDPRVHGKGLTANRSGEWRYRVGDYRVLCMLEDDVLVVEVFSIGHRSEVYRRLDRIRVILPGCFAAHLGIVPCKPGVKVGRPGCRIHRQ